MTNPKEEPIDEDEQDEILSQAMYDFTRQTVQICNVIQRVCQVVAILIILSTFYHSSIPESDKSNIVVSIFPCYSCFMHLVASRLVVQSKDRFVQCGETMATSDLKVSMEEFISWIGSIMIILSLVGIYMLGVSDIHTWSIAATNSMTLGTSLYFIYDTKKTFFAIQDLRSCKYKFKTL